MPAPRRALILRLDPETLAKVEQARGHLNRSSALRNAVSTWANTATVPHAPTKPQPKLVDWQAIINALPATITRQHAAAIISANLFPCSHKTLERWPLTKTGKRGGYAFTSTAEVLNIAAMKAGKRHQG